MDHQVVLVPGRASPELIDFWGRLLDESVVADVHDAWHAEAASIVIGANLSALLKPAPQEVAPLRILK
jgi:hypothetical protein